MLKELNEIYGTTFLIATHNNDLAGNCGRVAKLEKGRLNMAVESQE
jgi:ABC-type lipoprotein export system ATPase subunit